MSLDAIWSISQRIAQLQSMVADPASALAGAGSGGSSSSGTSFEAALAEALAAGTGTGTASGDGTSGGSLLDALGLTGSSASSGLAAPGLSGTDGTSSLLAALGLTGSSGPGAGGTTAGPTSAGVLNADGVPATLAAYGNGRIPAAALAPVGTTGARMWQPAAQALTSLIAAAKADGVTIGVTEAYRPYDEQVSLAKTKGLYSQGGLAAEPGTSEHGWGMAADLRLDARAQAWMQANAGRFGFVADTPREPWHWGYHPSAA